MNDNKQPMNSMTPGQKAMIKCYDYSNEANFSDSDFDSEYAGNSQGAPIPMLS